MRVTGRKTRGLQTEEIGCKCQAFFISLLRSSIVSFPGGSDGKASAYNVGDPGSIPGLGRSPGERNGNPLQYSCLENLHGQRNLVSYSPWGCKELDMTDFHFSPFKYIQIFCI